MRIGSSSVFDLAASGLAAASAALEGRASGAVHDTALEGGGVQVTISSAARAKVEDVREVGGRIAAVAAYRANLKLLQTADEVDPTKLLR
jgi:hypothetical protein